jgi:hypothetical protein
VPIIPCLPTINRLSTGNLNMTTIRHGDTKSDKPLCSKRCGVIKNMRTFGGESNSANNDVNYAGRFRNICLADKQRKETLMNIRDLKRDLAVRDDLITLFRAMDKTSRDAGYDEDMSPFLEAAAACMTTSKRQLCDAIEEVLTFVLYTIWRAKGRPDPLCLTDQEWAQCESWRQRSQLSLPEVLCAYLEQAPATKGNPIA